MVPIGTGPTDLAKVLKTLEDHFRCKTLANKLELKRKLFSMGLGERGLVQDHFKAITEFCDELAVIGESVNKKD